MFRSYRLAIIALGLTLVTGAWVQVPLEAPERHSQISSDNEGDQNGDATQSNQGLPTVESGVSVAKTTSSQYSDDEHKEGQDGSEYKLWGDSWAQWIMAICGAIAVAISGLGLYWLKRTLDATQASVDTAIEGVGIARKALTGLNRPYVIPVIIEHNLRRGLTNREMMAGDSFFYAKIAFKNFGASPAIVKTVATITGYRQINDDPVVQNPKFNTPEVQIVADAWILEGGKSTKTFNVRFGIPADLKAALHQNPIFAKIFREHDKPEGLVIPSIHDTITYQDMMGNITITRIRYDLTNSGFALNILDVED